MKEVVKLQPSTESHFFKMAEKLADDHKPYAPRVQVNAQPEG